MHKVILSAGMLLAQVALSKSIEVPLTKVEHDDVLKFKEEYGHELEMIASDRKRLGDLNSVEIPITLKKGYKYMGPIYFGTSYT